MKLTRCTLASFLLLATPAVAVAQTAAPCPPPRTPPPGSPAVLTGNASTLNAPANALTDVPAGSPLAGLPNGYRTEFDWAKMPANRPWGDARAIAVDKDGMSIWVLDRCDLTGNGCSKPENKAVHPLMKFDTNGNLLASYGAGLFAAPHGITVDHEGYLWTADGGPVEGCQAPGAPIGNKVRKWSTDGRVLMTISGPVNGKPFNGINEIVVSPVNGDIFVADGHGQQANNRIMKFDKTGKFVMEWGSRGKADDQFGIAHGLAMDDAGLIYVADRSNVAVKVFDQNGKLLKVWRHFGEPSGVYVKNDLLYVADNTANMPGRNPNMSPGVRIAKLDGTIIANVPYRQGNTLEGVTVDNAGNIYGANTNHPRAVRFMKN